jgi:hypothetical protein
MAVISRVGFGQVEPNHLSMTHTGQIYAQLPANKEIKQLENGQFAKYDIANGEVNFTGEGEWLLVFNEVKLYGYYHDESYKDYVMKADAFTEQEMTPRLVKTNVGDIFTTNTVGGAGSFREKYDGIDLNVGDTVTPGADGFLAAGSGDIEFTVVKVYTMPDGQPAVKLQRTK